MRKMNETLRFSWGHIFAFLAVIFAGYLTFMGVVYLQGGSGFGWAVGIALTVCILLLLIFLGLQRLKATSRNFAKRIVMERILLFASPVLFLILMLPYIHFWRVNTQSREISSEFRNAISDARGLFEEYDNYASGRVQQYDALLDSIIRAGHSSDLAAMGIPKDRPASMKTAMVKTLRLQLLSSQYDTLRSSALKWIDKASKGSSVWNIFLMGNIREIRNAVNGWEESLRTISGPAMSNETYKNIHTVTPFSSSVVPQASEALDRIPVIYQKFIWMPHWIAILTLLLLYGFLMVPYLLVQERHSKSTQHVFTPKNKESLYIEERPVKGKKSSPEDSDDDYGSFTL